MDMRKTNILIWICLMIFVSCQQEEMLTSRDYPFVISLDVSNIDKTGANVDFEVIKEGRSAISSYGIEYLESYYSESNYSNEEALLVEKQGVPAGNMGSIRLDTDLIAGTEYVVKPFVKAGSTTVYGESMRFQSRGGLDPEITEVSNSTLTGSIDLTIIGKNFNSRKEQNQILIPGMEDYFNIEMISTSNEKIVARLKRTYLPFPVSDEKYDLQLTTGGKTILLENQFSIGYPFIESITPLKTFVGNDFSIKLNANAYFGNAELYINNNIPALSYTIEDIAKEEVTFVMGNLPPGKYPIKLYNYSFYYDFPDSMEILNSWDVYRENSKIPNYLLDYHKITVGDKFLYWMDETGDNQEISIYDLKSNSIQKIRAQTENSFYRGGMVMTAAQNKYLYYGLGLLDNYNGPNSLNDFSRLDVTTGKWESLPAFPKESTRVLRSFEMQGRIYVVLEAYANFFIFDPESMSWIESDIDIPDELHWTTYKLQVVGNTIYYQTFLSIYSIKLGESSELIYNLEWNNQEPVMTAFENNLILNYGTYGIFKINMESKEIRPIQSVSFESNFLGIPWVTSEGLMFMNLHMPYGDLVNNNIYRLK